MVKHPELTPHLNERVRWVTPDEIVRRAAARADRRNPHVIQIDAWRLPPDPPLGA